MIARIGTLIAASLIGCGPICTEGDHCSVENGEVVCDVGYVESGDSVGPDCVPTAHYELSCAGPRCAGADDVQEYSGQYLSSFTCTWHCVRHDGVDNAYVSLRFESTDERPCWHLASEYVSDGICF